MADEVWTTFYQRWAGRVRLPDKVREQGDLLHRELLAATFAWPPAPVPVRAPSIALDGTPVIYSLQMPVTGEPAFRMLCEPGHLGMTVPAQIDHSLVTVDRILGALNWRSAADDINSVVAAAFPRDAGVVSTWWGGIWLGASIEETEVQLRMYINLRYGDAVARWQRVADILAPFADSRFEQPFTDLMQRVGAVAVPAGLGLVVADGRVPVLRLYLGMEEPSLENLYRARPAHLTGSDTDLAAFADAFAAAFGPFRRQELTLGYDFVRDADGMMQMQIARMKVDASVQHIAAGHEPAPISFLVDQVGRRWPQDVAHWERFAADLEACFGGADLEYISLSLRDRLSRMTAYVKPHGHAQEW